MFGHPEFTDIFAPGLIQIQQLWADPDYPVR